ncbi:MAG: hypothetical protein P1P86_02075 [Bacteroidales bacterium]|nr:hypothetical protein [Bacteroidales bacterium]
MRRDPNISKLIRESGVFSVPEDFTASVMDKIRAVPARKSYKPLIGRGGRILIILFFLVVIIFAALYTDPAGELFRISVELPQVERQWPQLNFNLEFLRGIKVSTGVVSALVALFILVLSDAGLSRRRFTQ